MLELGPLTPVILFLAISEMALGIYVFVKGHFSKVNRVFLWLTMLAAIGSLLDLMVASLTSEYLGGWALRLLVFLLICEMGVAYRLNSLVPHDTGMVMLRHNSLVYQSAVLIVAGLVSLTVGDIVRNESGWEPKSDVPFALLVIVLSIYVALMAISLHKKLPNLVGEKRRQAILFTFALSFPAVVVVLIIALGRLGATIPRFYGFGELISEVVVAYGILRYHILIPTRVTEPAFSPFRHVPSLDKGRSYLFESPNPERMFDSVVYEMSEGMSALIICRTHPDHLRAQYRLTKTPIIWLAQNPGPDRVDPSNLQLLSHMALEYIKKGPSLVAIEGLEYLIVNNELNKVLMFLGQLRDNIIVEGCILLVTVDPRTLTDRQRAILERELESVVEEEGAETAI
ncbi:MAG: DUF835 domain-containing protein [Methanomassiliicoccales archaeon]|nr:DUF835 domain-containing protein [Methanomassiliicoccales archaeon]